MKLIRKGAGYWVIRFNKKESKKLYKLSKICPFCGKEKDAFSLEWDYAMCEPCSIKNYDKESK